MLASLSIRDVVLIDRLDLCFDRGLSALTGETGAGKSILLDALGLSLGARGDARAVRKGASQAAVAARFEVPPEHPAWEVLAEHGIVGETDEGLTLRRSVGGDGRSRAYVNDQPVGVALLRRVGETLVEIHGQFDNQRLLDPAAHRALLDAFGGLHDLATRCAEAWRGWRQALDALAEERARRDLAERDEAFLRHALLEIEALDPRSGEEADLAGRRALLMNAEKLISALGDAADALHPPAGKGPANALRSAMKAIERIAAKAEGRFDGILGALERAAAEVEEAQELLSRAAMDADLDPKQLEQVEERLFALRALARKHAIEVDRLPDLAADMAERLAAIDDGAGRIARLEQSTSAARSAYCEAAGALSAARRAAAADLDARVARELEPLRLGRARFTTEVSALDPDDWSAAGTDRVAFLVATNPGADPGPIAKIASGGELARFTLALKVALAQADPVPTLIFDEVDAGVGGAVAAAVGERLARLGAEVQVLVVTHSPQVAARGRHHWRIAKETSETSARTVVDVLDPEGRREEIARMLAGARVTEEARAAATSLLEGCSP